MKKYLLHRSTLVRLMCVVVIAFLVSPLGWRGAGVAIVVGLAILSDTLSYARLLAHRDELDAALTRSMCQTMASHEELAKTKAALASLQAKVMSLVGQDQTADFMSDVPDEPKS